MRHLDLFSGIGGFALAGRWVWGSKHEIVSFVEIDKFAQRVLRKNFPGVPIHDEIKTFDATKYRGTIDLLTGGFPCQPYSIAGKRKGAADDRDLWPEMFRVIQEARPRWIIGENVANLVNFLEFERTCTDLEGTGYEVQAFIIPAVAVDAKQRRDRVWIVANAKQFRHRGRSNDNDSGESGEIQIARSCKHKKQAFMANAKSTKCQSPWDSWPLGNGFANSSVNAYTKVERLERTEPKGNTCTDGLSSELCDIFNATSKRLPDWSGGTMGQPWPVTEFERSGKREIECDFCGVAYGVSNRVDRIKGLGNAIVPQVAQRIMIAINKVELYWKEKKVGEH